MWNSLSKADELVLANRACQKVAFFQVDIRAINSISLFIRKIQQTKGDCIRIQSMACFNFGNTYFEIVISRFG